MQRRSIRAESRADALMVGLAGGYGMALLAWPGAPLIALGVWWTSNTIAHNFIHRSFFRGRAANGAFALYLSVVLGIPQALWRERHLAHHGGREPHVRWSAELVTQTAAVLALWITLAIAAPRFFATEYLTGYAAGLLLCALHGYYEHEHGGATSHYGRLYNLLLFNDGYHVEHHARPGVHWLRLPVQRDPGARQSAWPAPLRFLERCGLDGLERLVLRSRLLQRAVVAVHARALSRVVATVPGPVRSIGIVGGGLFPRSAIVLRRLCPAARLVIIDASRANLERARALLLDDARRPVPAGGHWGQILIFAPRKNQDLTPPSSVQDGGIEFRHARYQPGYPGHFDLMVIPLAYIGDRRAVYADPPAPAVIVHDWIWRKRGTSRIVALPLLKRVNLIRR